MSIRNLDDKHFISVTCKHTPAVQTVTSPQFHKMGIRLTLLAFLILCVLCCAVSVTVPLEDFNIETVQTNGFQLGNIIKVGCSSGYVRFRGKCRKKWGKLFLKTANTYCFYCCRNLKATSMRVK